MNFAKNSSKVLIDILTLKWLFVGLTLFYQRCVSPLLPRACIYYPSCSDYMLDSLKHYGALKGAFKGIKRLIRCVPWREGGFDPLPINPKGDIKWLY